MADLADFSLLTGVKAVLNPSGTIPDGLNAAIANSRGEIVIRVDARCDVAPNFVTTLVSKLDDPAIGSVGGAALVLDRGIFGSAYAVAFNSPLLGPSTYRYGAISGPTDTAYLGAWRRSDLEAIGGFDSRLIRNQDNELASRIRATGKTIWYDADAVVGYRNGRGLKATLAHHREFGLWRMAQRSHGQAGFDRRHLVALGSAGGAALTGLGLLASPTGRKLVAATSAAAYVAAGAGAYRTARRLRSKRPDIVGPDFHPVGVALAPALATAINASWLSGVIQGRFMKPDETWSAR